ncbi:MAG: uroporphyrinogen decarboxylase family protein [Eubacteriales bacterium]
MTNFEAVKTAITHKSSAHVPYAINLAADGADAYAERLISEYASEKIKNDYKEGRLNRSEAYSLAIGNHMLNIGCPWWSWHSYDEPYNTPDAPSTLPRTIGYGSYEGFFEKCRYIKENYDVYLLVTIWGSHFEKAYFARGIENFLADLAGEPEFAEKLLKMIIRKNIVMLENFLFCENIDGVLLGSDWGSQKDMLMSPAVWRSLIKDGELEEYNLIHSYSKDVFVHSCGNICRILPDLCEMGVNALNPVQPECMDIFELKRLYGDKLTFWGGISTQRTLPLGTPDEVYAETADTIAKMSVGGGFITSPSQEIQADVPYENLRALIECAKEHAGS